MLVTLLVLLACVVQGVLAGNASALTGVPCLQTGLETVATDAPDYPPGSTVHITGTGYAPGCDATVQITRPDSVVESFTATTDLEGNLGYDYLLPPPPGVIGDYALDILGLNGVLASMTFTDGGAKVNKIFTDAALTNEGYQFAVGDTVYAQATNLDAARGYKLEAFNAANVSQYLGPCKTGATSALDSYEPTTPSGLADWTWVLHEWTSSTCASGPQSEDADNTLGFKVAQATAYTSSALTTPTTAFPAAATAFVVVNGLDQSVNNWSTTWVAAGVSCANTNAGDRPDSDANGKLPSSYLAYPPANTFADVWNKLSSYESTTCPAFATGNAGQWKVTLTANATHSVTMNVFVVDTTAPTVTVNQASGQADPTIASPINFTATFSEPVSGFIGSDVSFAGSTAGTGGTPTGLSATVTGGPTVYNVAVSGMATRGNVVVSIPAGSAQDAATNGNTASTSTDNSVTWDRVPATTAPTFSPPSPKTNDTLTASTTTSDPDGDNISVSWTWKVNRGGNVCTVQTSSSGSAPAGVRTSTLDLSQNYAPTSCTGAMINPLNPSKGDVVRVEATPNDGLFDGTLQLSNITVVNTTPTVTLSGGNNLSPNEGSTYTYNYSISDADGDTIASVATSCGTGNKTNATNTNTSGSFDCTFADGPASTSVSAQATDTGFGAGAGNNATQPISVQNVAPSIAISGAAFVDEGSTYSLTLGAVSDPGTDTVSSYVVHWGDGNTDAYGTNGVKTHTYADGPDDHAITVDLIDEDGTFLDRANALSVHVNNVAPSIGISGAASVDEGSVYTLTLGAVTDPGTDTISDYVVHWGDGNTSHYASNGAKTHTYADGDNTYDVTVDLTDEDGTFADHANAKAVAVDNVAPTVTLTGPSPVDEGSTNSYSYTTSDPGDEVFARDDQSCDGGTLTDANFSAASGVGSFKCTYPDGLSTHHPSVTVSDGDGGSDSDSLTVAVENVAPSIAISGAASVDEGSSYSLTLGAVSDPGTDTVSSYVVHWGDGSTDAYGTNGVKTHTYADGPDDHAVTVDLIDEDGTFLNRANALSVHVNNVAPTAHLSGDDEVFEGTTHTYTFTVTDPGVDSFTVNTPDYPDCGTGGDYVGGSLTTNAGGGSFQCTFPDGPATTDVKIRVTDSDGAFDTDTENVVVVDVLNVDPVVTLTGPSSVAEGSTHNYSYTTTDDGSPETFSRDAQSCDGGTLSADTFNPVDGSGSFDCTYADGPSTHNPTVTVSDGDGGSGSNTVAVTVTNVAPTIAISGAASLNEGSSYSLTLGAVTDPGTDTVSSYVVHWGDGNTDAFGTNGVKAHTYADGPNDWEITVDLVDEDGTFLDAANDRLVHVNNVAPTIAISGNANVNEGSLYTLTLGAVTDPGSDTVSDYVVHWGDGSSDSYGSNGAKTHIYADGDNTYNVTVDLTDEDGTYLDVANAKSVTVDNVAPTTPNLTSPADNATTGDNTPAFDWGDSTDPAGANDTTTYRIQIDNNCDFSSPERDQITSSSDFTPVASLADGTYCWRVNASDEDGDSSAYSSVRHLTIDTAAPTVQSIDRAGDNPTNASSVDWTVTFSESVNGVDSSDFALVQSGGVAGASITGVSGTGATYTVTANTGAGNGSLGLNLNDNDSVSDAGGNSLRAPGGGADGSFTGQVYTIDKVGPTVTVNQAVGQSDPTSASQIHFTAVFNEPVVGFQNMDVTIGGTAGAVNASVTNSGDDKTFDIEITGMTTSGTVTASINAGKATDAAGNGNSASTSTDNTVTWTSQSQNVAPVVTITSPTFGQLYAKGSANVSLAATFTDPDGPSPHTCSINWDDGVVQSGVVNETLRTCTKAHTFANAGVYTINVSICDNLGACGTATVWVVVYDPSAGFVTGGGWINVAAGSYPTDPTLTGRANFGFNSKYKNGGGPPTGETEFNFSVANFNFHSTNYQWLVVSSFKAQYKGTGEVNGVPGYDFRLTAYDGQINGGGGIDKFRIKITRNGQTIFDNRMGAPEDPDVADPQAIAGGSIVIHRS